MVKRCPPPCSALAVGAGDASTMCSEGGVSTSSARKLSTCLYFSHGSGHSLHVPSWTTAAPFGNAGAATPSPISSQTASVGSVALRDRKWPASAPNVATELAAVAMNPGLPNDFVVVGSSRRAQDSTFELSTEEASLLRLRTGSCAEVLPRISLFSLSLRNPADSTLTSEIPAKADAVAPSVLLDANRVASTGSSRKSSTQSPSKKTPHFTPPS